MTRSLLLVLVLLGITPAVLLALANLFAAAWSAFPLSRRLWFSARLYSRDGRSWDLEPALNLSAATSCVILLGASLLVFGLWRLRPEVSLKPTKPSSSQSKSD